MVNALKLVSLNRGHDPRDFTLVAFGGGGAMHAVALAAELGVKKVVVPAGASVFSAWGMMMSDLRRDYFVTRLAELNARVRPRASKRCSRKPRSARRAQFAAEGIDAAKVKFLRYGKFRYQNQEHTIEVLITGGTVTDDRLARRSRQPSTTSTSANTPTGSTRRSRWSASISSPRPRSASSPCASAR